MSAERNTLFFAVFGYFGFVKSEKEDTFQYKMIKTITDVTNEQTATLKQELSDLKLALNLDLKTMREEIDILKKKCDRIDRLIRRDNVIFFGLECANKDLLQLVLNVFETRLKVGVTVSDLDDVCTIGKGKLNRPIIVRFVSHLKKREVLANVKLLKGTKLFLAEDLT